MSRRSEFFFRWQVRKHHDQVQDFVAGLKDYIYIAGIYFWLLISFSPYLAAVRGCILEANLQSTSFLQGIRLRKPIWLTTSV